MPYIAPLLAIAAVHLAAVASPGPSFVATIQLAARHSRKIVVWHALGLSLAALTWAVVSVLGIQVVIMRASWLYRTLQLAGGIYLFYIGWRAWRSSGRLIITPDTRPAPLSTGVALRRGFATNIANPKVMVFFASIFASLLNPGMPVWVRFAALAIVAIDELCWYATVGWILSSASAQRAYERAKTGVDRIAGSAMMLFGAKLIWSARN